MKKIYLVDANSFIYRMFYGVPEMRTKTGEVVNAIFGIAKFFLVQMLQEKPDYLIFIKDAKGETFRHQLDENYKATRDKMPDNLRNQIPIIEEMIKKMQIPIIEIPGVEADDVIGTLAKELSKNKENEIFILSGDKDLYSLVSDNVKIYDTMKKKKFGIEETKEKFGIAPKMIIDYLAIVGDKADNIPGIDGFGPKKAVSLINEIGGIEKIYELLDFRNFENLSDTAKKIFKGKNLEKLENSRENAFLSKKLATIKLDVPLENFSLDKFVFEPSKYLTDEVKELFRKLEFFSLLNEDKPKLKKWEDLNLKVNIIGDNKGLLELLKKIKEKKEIVLDTETTSLNIMKAKLVGISIFIDEKNIFYINIMHRGAKVEQEDLKEFLKNLFDLDITIIGHNIKYDLEVIDLFLNQNTEKIEEISKNEEQMSLEF